MHLYIDFTKSVASPKYSYHGGGYYARWFLQELYAKLEPDHKIGLFVPMDYEPVLEEERMLFSNPHTNLIPITEAKDYTGYQNGDILYLPLVMDDDLSPLKKLKKNNPGLKIYATLHGPRNFDFAEKIDPYDRYYYKSRVLALASYFHTFLLNPFYRRRLKQGMAVADKVFTDSNNSMRQLCRDRFPTWISLYYLTVLPVEPVPMESIPERFILFVSGGRREKNYLRAIDAFCAYKEAHPEDDTYLLVTGNKKKIEDTVHFMMKDCTTFEKWVRLVGYVDEANLQYLYQKMRFLLYPSRSEGFGLPVLNAVLRGRPVVASGTTSVPEVAGTAVYYVDPYSKESIQKGIQALCNDTINARYTRRVQEYAPLLIKLGVLAKNSLLDEFLQND